ncbi:MAG: type II toxin-antitoxin system RelE/ParE family toxin [Rugosibacter sp.]|nr:type II toxin-antitoxin system RelE/ParE family toxin [Rugosibacter sp.]
MLGVTFSPKARQDLVEIGDFIAKDSRANARRFVAKLMTQCQRIAHAPMGYPSREDLAASLRMASMGRYVIFFRVLDDMVRIERVLHGARDMPAIFGQGVQRTAE